VNEILLLVNILESPLLSIVIPAFNEEDNIGNVLKDAHEVLEKLRFPYEIIVVDDGSHDKTAEIANKNGVILINNKQNLGKGGALKAGFVRARGSIIITMENTILTAYAKINLSLNLFPQRGEGGYYRVRFLNTQVSLSDTVIISKTPDKSILINEPRIDERENIAYRAAKLMFAHFDLPGGVSIAIKKHIPLKAGLGGGSCDAGAVINGIVNLFGLDISISEKLILVKELGMDVCYCAVGGLCKVCHKFVDNRFRRQRAMYLPAA